MYKGQWNELSLLSVMVARFFSWGWKIFQQWQWSLELSKYSQNERDVWIQLSIQSIQCGHQCTWGFCSPEQRAFQRLHSMSNASPLMSGSYTCLIINWSSVAIVCRYVGINRCAVKVGLGQRIGLPILPQYYRQTRCRRRISNNGIGNLPQHTRPDRHYCRLTHHAISLEWSLPLLLPIQGQDSAVGGTHWTVLGFVEHVHTPPIQWWSHICRWMRHMLDIQCHLLPDSYRASITRGNDAFGVKDASDLAAHLVSHKVCSLLRPSTHS